MTKRRQATPERGSHQQRPTHTEEGVDLTLIRWMLSLTPEERIRTLEDNVYSLLRLRNGTVATRLPDDPSRPVNA